MKRISWIAACLCFFNMSRAQQVTLTPDQIKGYTSEWKGERFPDGRPKVADKFLERLKKIRLEEGWGILRNKGYQNQFEGDWMILEP
ncbi:MAG: RraA family protein, partial [Pedobacter sp.]